MVHRESDKREVGRAKSMRNLLSATTSSATFPTSAATITASLVSSSNASSKSAASTPFSSPDPRTDSDSSPGLQSVGASGEESESPLEEGPKRNTSSSALFVLRQLDLTTSSSNLGASATSSMIPTRTAGQGGSGGGFDLSSRRTTNDLTSRPLSAHAHAAMNEEPWSPRSPRRPHVTTISQLRTSTSKLRSAESQIRWKYLTSEAEEIRKVLFKGTGGRSSHMVEDETDGGHDGDHDSGDEGIHKVDDTRENDANVQPPNLIPHPRALLSASGGEPSSSGASPLQQSSRPISPRTSGSYGGAHTSSDLDDNESERGWGASTGVGDGGGGDSSLVAPCSSHLFIDPTSEILTQTPQRNELVSPKASNTASSPIQSISSLQQRAYYTAPTPTRAQLRKEQALKRSTSTNVINPNISTAINNNNNNNNNNHNHNNHNNHNTNHQAILLQLVVHLKLCLELVKLSLNHC